MILFDVLLFVGLIFLSYATENCPNSEESVHNLYIPEQQRYINLINEAMIEYDESHCTNHTCYSRVIENDLSSFQNGITRDVLQSAYANGVKYQVINHQVYRVENCLFPSRCEGVDYFLNKIRKELPDIEFAINFHDWPQISRRFNKNLPVFSFSKTPDYLDIMYPAWSFWKGGPAIKLYPVGIGKWEEHSQKIIEKSKKWPWDRKRDVAFFRGSRTSSERDNLILLSRSKPALVDAAYTKNQAWKSEKDTLNLPPAEEVSLQDHCKYRYLFNFRGVAASFRLKYLFLCNSLVFHVGNEWKEFFYDSLKPWVHYIPLDSNYTEEELEKLLLFFKSEEKIAKQIAKRGFDFVQNNLKIEDVVWYWKKLLLSYSNLLKFKPVLDNVLINVTA